MSCQRPLCSPASCCTNISWSLSANQNEQPQLWQNTHDLCTSGNLQTWSLSRFNHSFKSRLHHLKLIPPVWKLLFYVKKLAYFFLCAIFRQIWKLGLSDIFFGALSATQIPLCHQFWYFIKIFSLCALPKKPQTSERAKNLAWMWQKPFSLFHAPNMHNFGLPHRGYFNGRDWTPVTFT